MRSFLMLGIKSDEKLSSIKGIEALYAGDEYEYANGIVIKELYLDQKDLIEMSVEEINKTTKRVAKKLNVPESEIKLIYGMRE